MGRWKLADADAGTSDGPPKEETGEKDGREGVHGREVETVRMQAGRLAGD